MSATDLTWYMDRIRKHPAMLANALLDMGASEDEVLDDDYNDMKIIQMPVDVVKKQWIRGGYSHWTLSPDLIIRK